MVNRAERWRIVYDKLRLAVPEEFQCYIQFKNKELSNLELDINIPWLNVINLFVSKDSWSHLLVLKFFMEIKNKPELIIKEILIDIAKDTQLDICRNNSCGKLLTLTGTNEDIKISNYILENIQKGIKNLSNIENKQYHESINKNTIEQDFELDEIKEVLDPIGDALTTLFLNSSQRYKYLMENQMEIMIGIINKSNKIMDFHDWLKEQYDTTMEIQKLILGNWKEILSKAKDYQNKSIMPSELFNDGYEFVPVENNTMEIFGLIKSNTYEYKQIRSNSMDNSKGRNKSKSGGNIKFIKIEKNKTKENNSYKNLWDDEILGKKNKTRKFLMQKTIRQNEIYQMELDHVQENQLFVWIIQNKYKLIQEYIDNKKIKLDNYGKDVQEKLKWLNKQGYINNLK